jgi:hypothetical protein
MSKSAFYIEVDIRSTSGVRSYHSVESFIAFEDSIDIAQNRALRACEHFSHDKDGLVIEVCKVINEGIYKLR